MKIKDRYANGHAQRRIDQVRVGDRLDLQNDRYADPKGLRGVETVRNIEHETKTCIRLDFDNLSVGFPLDHWIDVDGEQIR